MAANDKFLNQRQRYQPVTLPQEFSEEEMIRDWTLTDADRSEIEKYRKNSRLFVAVQICAVRLYGRFLSDVGPLSPRIVHYLNGQLALPPTLAIATPNREATFSDQRKNILHYLGFSKYSDHIEGQLRVWLAEQAGRGFLFLFKCPRWSKMAM